MLTRNQVAAVILAGIAALSFETGGDLVRAADSLVAQKLKAEVARRQAEVKRKIEQKRRQVKAATGNRSSRSIVSPNSRPATTTSAPPPVPFDASLAPSPAACFEQYVATAKNAGSMEQILPYLPESQQTALRARQSIYDPQQAAKNRQWHKQQDPKLSEESLNYLSNPPLVNELKFHKNLAASVIKVLSEKIDGNKATLVVSIHSDAIVNGERYPYSTADVEMIGEGRLWRSATFQPSIMVRKNPR
jgi:hypothetical protein